MKKESGMISLVEVDDAEEDDEVGGFGLGSSFFSGIISHSSDGCTRGEGGTSGVHSIADFIADSISTSLCKILFIGVDRGELNISGVDGGVSVVGSVG